MVTLHISYKDGCAYVAIDEDGKRRQHKTIYKNTDDKEQNTFCAEVATKVQAELGQPVQWKMAEKKQLNMSTMMKAAIAVFVTGIVASLMVPILNIIFPSPSHSPSSSSYFTSSSSSMPVMTNESSSTQPKKNAKVFEFGDGEWEYNSIYTVYTGSITNISDTTHYFVQVRGSFKDESDSTIDIDSTYACGEEGLRPGESTKFRLSVKNDSRIASIGLKVFDYK